MCKRFVDRASADVSGMDGVLAGTTPVGDIGALSFVGALVGAGGVVAIGLVVVGASVLTYNALTYLRGG